MNEVDSELCLKEISSDILDSGKTVNNKISRLVQWKLISHFPSGEHKCPLRKLVDELEK